MSSLYGQFDALLTELRTNRPAEACEVSSLRGQATAYVWGFQDALTEYGSHDIAALADVTRDTGDSTEFGYAYGIHAAEYALGKRSMRQSIQGAFDDWRKGETLA